MLKRAFLAVLDAVIPPRERAVRLRMQKASDLPLSPRTAHTSAVMSLMPYHGTAAEDAVRALKYDGSTDAARLLAHALEDYLREEIAALKLLSPRPVLLVPVPLHPKRERERGFNQIERVLHELPQEFRDGSTSRLELRALFRVRATPPQTKLARAERLRNVRGAFSAHHALVRGAHVIVIDDVVTTGATLGECTKTLEKAGARASAIAFARA